MSDVQFSRHTVTLEPVDVAIIRAADTNRAGMSATLRRIVREWEILTTHYQFDPTATDAYDRDQPARIRQYAATLAEAREKYVTEEE